VTAASAGEPPGWRHSISPYCTVHASRKAIPIVASVIPISIPLRWAT
jgi:hypothetical protein